MEIICILWKYPRSKDNIHIWSVLSLALYSSSEIDCCVDSTWRELRESLVGGITGHVPIMLGFVVEGGVLVRLTNQDYQAK